MGNTCVGPNLTKNAFFHSVSATIWRSRSDNEFLPPASDTGSIKDSSAVATYAPKPVKIDGIDSRPSKVLEVVGNPAPANPSKKPTQVKRIECSVGLQAGFVFKLKTENLKEIYNLGRKLGQGQFGTTFLCVDKATGKVYACKSILKRKLVTEDDIEDVRKEIQITAPLVWPPQCHLHQRGLRRCSGSPFGHGVVRRWGALR